MKLQIRHSLPRTLIMSRSKVNIRLAQEVYALTRDDLERFDAVYHGRESLFEDDVRVWRYWRRTFKSDQCRVRFLSSVCVESDDITTTSIAGLASVARYICFRVEERVLQMDGQR